MYPSQPALTLFDPLGALLGWGEGEFTYTFAQVVALTGHGCPTTAGAFLLTCRAVELLYGQDMPQRGDLRITLPGGREEGVLGVMGQVFTLLTGAAGSEGFKGLAGQMARDNLLIFAPGSAVPGKGGFLFQRLSTGAAVRLGYAPGAIPAAPTLGADMQQVLSGQADAATRRRFTQAWHQRVLDILEDAGQSTVSRLAE
ncbi:MAG: hypothetical protein H7831_11075 [Magnetococcus sp. WYHC-3]